ncbi:MAG TPA: response regulator transcription factor [Anaerolineaceae bacterium]|nr:response regulator transcription factor [Anaerolineaceae bacterium]
MISHSLRLVVVDDHTLFRRGLISLLEGMPEFQVVGQANDGEEALKVIESTRPDIVLLDVNMPQMDGIATVRALRSNHQTVKILMLTISKNDQDLLGAIRAGADGYLIKSTEPDDLRKSLLRLADGQGVLSPEITAPLMRALAHPDTNDHQPFLSDRELEVLNCLAEGQTTQQIAACLFISENTVKTHIRHILEKMESSNRTEAVSKAIQLKLIQKNQ